MSNRIRHLTRTQRRDAAVRELGPETEAQLARRAKRAKDLGVQDAEVTEIEPAAPDPPVIPIAVPPPRPEPKSATQPLPKPTPKGSCGLSMPCLLYTSPSPRDA